MDCDAFIGPNGDSNGSSNTPTHMHMDAILGMETDHMDTDHMDVDTDHMDTEEMDIEHTDTGHRGHGRH